MLTIENKRLRAGLSATDTTKDSEVNAAFSTALTIAESYCNRKFMFSVDSETFTRDDGIRLQLHRIPVTKYTEPAGHEFTYFAKKSGVALIAAAAAAETVTIDYEGGYTDATIPADLELALLLIFDSTYASLKPSAAGGGTVGAGGIESVTLKDVGTVRFATGSGSSSNSSGVSGLLSSDAASILRFYRIEEC